MKVTALHIELHRTTPLLIIFLEQQAHSCMRHCTCNWQHFALDFFFSDANCRTIYFVTFGSGITDDARTHLSDAKSPIKHTILCDLWLVILTCVPFCLQKQKKVIQPLLIHYYYYSVILFEVLLARVGENHDRPVFVIVLELLDKVHQVRILDFLGRQDVALI